MFSAALARLDEPASGRKLALRRSGSPCTLVSGLPALQPANDVGESCSSYDEQASGSCFWTQKDPIGFLSGQWNIYVYAGDDPVNGGDPTGTITFDCAVCLGASAAAGGAGFAACEILTGGLGTVLCVGGIGVSVAVAIKCFSPGGDCNPNPPPQAGSPPTGPLACGG
jgi:uncharacterized protein RhaS with RHS repeats